MPSRTQLLDHGGFVQNPDSPPDEPFRRYLDEVDRLCIAYQEACQQWSQSPFTPGLLQQKNRAEQQIDDFLARYQDRYALGRVEHNEAFLPVAKFFARYYPVRRPFAILYCSVDVPLHTVYLFESQSDLDRLNAALEGKAILRWWQDGPSGRPCYLFGHCVWELKPAEVDASENGLILLLEEAVQREEMRRRQLGARLAAAQRSPSATFVPEAVRAAAYRRCGGRCARCGSRQELDFVLVRPAAPVTADNVQLLCADCQRDC
jgi:hypothetical protein